MVRVVTPVSGSTEPTCTGSLWKFGWPARWPYMSSHACTELKCNSVGETRTTGPYLSWRSLFSNAMRPRRSALIPGIGLTAFIFGPGNFAKGSSVTR